ncbi:MAG: ShlB/FhaC/HecB family hemolysin secretion/activation protein [Gallionella sp.]
MQKNRWIACSLLLFSQSPLAAQPPNAASQIQQIPASPVRQPALEDTAISPVEPAAIEQAYEDKIRVDVLKIAGAQAYPEEVLLGVAGFKAGDELTLNALRSMTKKIADYYHRNGYFVAQAYLPVQDIKEGRVIIAVLEGQYGDLMLRNRSTLTDDLAHRMLNGLHHNDPITAAPLEHALLSLSDIPGIKVQSTLIPGTNQGYSDLIVEVADGPRISGSIDADNAGNRYTGEGRIGATLNLNNPAGLGDQATLRGLTSISGLNYLRAAYQSRIGNAKAGIAYSRLDYALGRDFAGLSAHGTASIVTLYGNYPLIRSRNNNLNTQISLESRAFQDKVDLTSSVTDKKSQVLMLSLYGDHRDNRGAGGFNAYTLSWTTGQLNLQSPAMQSLDAATAQSNGRYNKLGFGAIRLQGVSTAASLYLSFSGQLAGKNLDVSEKMQLGGMNGVRAYPEGEAYADQGYLMNLEARYQLNNFSSGVMQLIGFVDAGSVNSNKYQWAAGANRTTLSGAGVGVNWSATRSLVVKAFYARKLGNAIAQSAPDSAGRFWIQAVQYF